MKQASFHVLKMLAALAGLCLSAPAPAQEAWPSKAVRMIMPFPPGSGTDVLARLISEQLSRKWGQAVTVDNMAGAGGNLGGQVASRAAPDGHTLLFVPAPPLVINQFMYRSTGYDPTKFAPISMVASVPYALVTRKDFPANTMKELVAHAKANPGKVTYASSSIGSTAQLAALQLSMMNGLDMVHVPFRGAAPALTDVMGGHVDMVFDIVSTALPMWESDKVKVLGTGGQTRSRIMPTIPTIDEAGFPGFQALTWFAIVAPPGTPEAITGKIYRDTLEALRVPEVSARIAAMGMDVVGMNPEDSGKFFAQEAALWGKIVRDAKISLD
jgi:tripartite-type tricarboxylate transporter receptor subunit TctC